MPRRRGNGFSTVETQTLLDAIEKYLPIGNVSWGRVTAYHTSRFPAQERTVDSLRRKFSSLYRQNIPTGDPRCPEEVRRAKHLHSDIKKKSELSTAESDEEDEVSIEEEEDEGWNDEEEEGEEVEDYDSDIVCEEEEDGRDEDGNGGGGDNVPNFHHAGEARIAVGDNGSLLEPVRENIIRVPSSSQEQDQVNSMSDTNQNVSTNPSSINKSTTATSHHSTSHEVVESNPHASSMAKKKKSRSATGIGANAQQGNQKKVKAPKNGTVAGGSGAVKFGKSSGTVIQKGTRKITERKIKNAGDDDEDDDLKFKDVLRMMIHQKEMEDVRYQREMEMGREDNKLAREQRQRLMDVLVMSMMSNNQRTGGAQSLAAGVPSPHGTYLTNTIQSPTLCGAPLQHVSFPPQQFPGIRGEEMYPVGRSVMTDSSSGSGSSTGNHQQNDDFGNSSS